MILTGFDAPVENTTWGAIFSTFIALSFLYSFFAVQVKRCHDIGWSGWWSVLSFVPYVQWAWWLVLGTVTKKWTEERIKGVEEQKERFKELEKEQQKRREEAEALKRRKQQKGREEEVELIRLKQQARGATMEVFFDKYAEYTKAGDWNAICKLNDVELDSFGTKKELKVLPEYLEPDEVVFALTSGIMKQTETSNPFDFGLNTWLVVLTSDRFLFS